MQIYSIQFDSENYLRISPVSSKDLEDGNLWINGNSKRQEWQSILMSYSCAEDKEEIADITRVSPGFYTFNRKAIDALGDILISNGELLELLAKGAILHAFNPMNTISCLDQTLSVYRTKTDGSMGSLITPRIDTSKIPPSTPLFQIPELIQTKFFVTDIFKDRYDDAGLTGLLFKQIN